MKKALIILGLSISLTGCGNSTSTNKTTESTGQVESTKPTQEIETETNKIQDVQNKPIEEVKNEYPTQITVSTEVATPIGDRTADNVSEDNGDYFAIGSDIVPCSDYDCIHVKAILTNTREELLNTSAVAWSAAMEDGYELELFQNGTGVGFMNDGDLGRQIQAGSSDTFEFDIYKKKDIKGDKIILKYWDINFDDKYSEFMSAVMGGASEEECKKNYPGFFDESMYQIIEIPLQ